MFTAQDVKGAAERLTGFGRPGAEEVTRAVRPRKANSFRFDDDGIIPNNPKLPLILYRSPVRLRGDFDPAALFEDLFQSNGWADGWRDGVYDFTHYHSQTHEVLGIARGNATVRFGGSKGRRIQVKAGDVIIIPAGVSHSRLAASDDFLVVGAYPASGRYNEYRETQADHDKALEEIPKVAPPEKDPVFGLHGPLMTAWRAQS